MNPTLLNIVCPKRDNRDVQTVREKKKKKSDLNSKDRGGKRREAVMRSSTDLHCSTSAGDIFSSSGSQPPPPPFTFISFRSPTLFASFWSSGLCSDQVLIFKNMYCLYEPCFTEIIWSLNHSNGLRPWTKQSLPELLKVSIYYMSE